MRPQSSTTRYRGTRDHTGRRVDLDPADMGRLRPTPRRGLEVVGGVEAQAEARVRASSGARWARRATSARPIARSGEPRTATTPSTMSRSDGLASSRSATTASTCSRTVRAAPIAAPLASVAARLPPVDTMLNGVSRVSPWTTATDARVDAELVGDDLGQGGLVALAVRRLAGEHRDRPVELETDPRPLERSLLVGEPQRLAVVGRAGTGFEIRAEPHPEEPALGAPGGLLGAKRSPGRPARPRAPRSR